MSIEEEIFASYRVVTSKLSNYGFECFKDVYTFKKSIMDDEFDVEIVIDEKGTLKGKVIEKQFNEEYAPMRIDSYKGEFVGNIREEYKSILLDIRKKCFRKQLFVSNQANRLAVLIKDKYKENPDFPFDDKKYKDLGVFRYHGNQKWYGLVMNVSKSVFDFSDNNKVDVINLKIDESKRDEILKIKGIYPSYHMNKNKWISVLLDETLSDDQVMDLIDTSRNLIIGKTKRKNNEVMYYIQPANPKIYDLDAAFIRDKDETIWKQSRKVNVGDICYMYLANPVGAVKYKCIVTETDIPYTYTSKEVSMKKVMKIKVIKRFKENNVTFQYLKSIGIPLIRGPVSIDKSIADKIDLNK